MDRDINDKKRKGEQAMVLLYEKNGVGETLHIELHYEFFL